MKVELDPFEAMDQLFEDAGLEGGGQGVERDRIAGDLYFAYGSNLNERQMSYRCPDAIKMGGAQLRGWRLAFSGVADIRERHKDDAAGKARVKPGGRLNRQAGLADATRPKQGHEALSAQHAPHGSDLAFATDEATQRGGEGTQVGTGADGHG